MATINQISDYRGLNPYFARKQGITTQKEIDDLHAVHIKRRAIFELMKGLDPDNTFDRKLLKKCDQMITLVDYELQRLWKFQPDKNYHTWWCEEPHCRCPKIDNRDPIYLGRGRIIRQDCPIHG